MVIGTKPNFKHKSIVDKRGLTNRANVHTPFVKESFKTQRGRIDPAIFAANWASFHSKKKEKKTNNGRSEVTRVETRAQCHRAA